MTIDNDTALAVVRPISEILDSYRNDSASDLQTLVDAIGTDHKALAKAVRARKLDEAQGIAIRLRKMADKAKELAEYTAERGR